MNKSLKVGEDERREKHEAFFGTVTVHHTADIIAGTEQQQKCYNQVFSGPLFLKMLTSLCVVVIDAREQGGYHGEMRCRCRTSWRWKSLTVGA